MKKAINFKGDLNQFLQHYNYQPKLTPYLDKQHGKFNKTLIYEIVLWKLNRFVNIPKKIIDELNKLINLKKRQHQKGKEVLSKLLEIKGIDLPMASTILRFKNPNVFQIIDRHTYRVVYGKKYNISRNSPIKHKIKVYFDYLNELTELCNKKKIEFQTADKLLYSFDKKVNKKYKLY